LKEFDEVIKTVDDFTIETYNDLMYIQDFSEDDFLIFLGNNYNIQVESLNDLVIDSSFERYINDYLKYIELTEYQDCIFYVYYDILEDNFKIYFYKVGN
jgi:hypothetical protein